MVFSQWLNSQRIFKRLAKALISLRVCAGWSEPLPVAQTTLLEISCSGSNVRYLKCKHRARGSQQSHHSHNCSVLFCFTCKQGISIHLAGEELAFCFTLHVHVIVLLLSCLFLCYVSFPRGALDWSVVCDISNKILSRGMWFPTMWNF